MVAEEVVEVEEEALPEGYCAECRLPLDSQEHKRGVTPGGVGLHGHIRQNKRDADEQRRDVLKRAHASAVEAQREEARAIAEAAGFVVSEPKKAESK